MSLPSPLRARLVRYAELAPCTNAFIDARSPGSDQKENFTIIGAGVAENPRQHVHIREPHGFNIGGARQPPGCTNSLHSHNTAEVFVILNGAWRFFWGEAGDAGSVVLYAGDTISLPIHMFRGFENVGTKTSFMFAVLGGDDPGRVHWAPQVIEKARSSGLVLLENGNLIDTTLGEVVPVGEAVVQPSSPAEIAYIRTPSVDEMSARVVPRSALRANPGAALAASGVRESAIIGFGTGAEHNWAAPINNAHGFTLGHLALNKGAKTIFHARDCVEVLLVHRGHVRWHNHAGDSARLSEGDTFSIPRGMPRQLEALSHAEIFVVRGGDNPGPLTTHRA